MTNKDWIQKMETEELKDFLEGFIPCLCCDRDKEFCNLNCGGGIWDWLSREHEEAQNDGN